MSVLVINKWNKAMTAPSNSAPRPLLIVVGLNAFQIILSLQVIINKFYITFRNKAGPTIKLESVSMTNQILVAMNKDIPDPRPYPF